MLRLFLGFLFISGGTLVHGQLSALTNVRLQGFVDYVVQVIGETMRGVEQRGWSNLKLADMTEDVDEMIMGWHVAGTVNYINGFVASIMAMDILQDIRETWRFSSDSNTTTVHLQGKLRLHNVALGFDVIANLNNEIHRFTGVHEHNLVTYDFTILKNANTDEFYVTVELDQLPASLNRMTYLPDNSIAEVLSIQYNRNSTHPSISGWGPLIFQPIALDVATTKIQFPTICYNCNTS